MVNRNRKEEQNKGQFELPSDLSDGIRIKHNFPVDPQLLFKEQYSYRSVEQNK